MESPDEPTDSPRVSNAIAEWSHAAEQNRLAFEAIHESLPPGARVHFAENLLHDARIESVEQGTSELTFTLRHVATRLWPSIVYRLVIYTVQLAEGIDVLEGQHWLYHEVHLTNDAAFELRVLCDKTSFRVMGEEVTLSQRFDVSQ